MLVVRVGQTKRQNAHRAVEVLKELGTPILGTVINAIDFEAEQYGYGYGYGVYGYGRPSRTTSFSQPCGAAMAKGVMSASSSRWTSASQRVMARAGASYARRSSQA